MRTVVVAIALLLAGCDAQQPPAIPGALAPQGEVLMTINGTDLTAEMIDAVKVRIPPEQLEQMEQTPGQMDMFYDQIALGQVLYERALAENLHEDPEVQAGLAMAAREFLAGMYVQRASEAAVSDEAVRAYYEERSVQFAKPQVQARHILVKEQSLAEDLIKQLNDGADFVALAQEHTLDTGSAQRGGDLGWFEDGRMLPEFSEAAFGAEKGEIVGPVQTRFGFHVIQVTDKRDVTPLDEVRPRIVSTLRQEALENVIETARSEMVLEKKGAAKSATPPNPHAGLEGLEGGLPQEHP